MNFFIRFVSFCIFLTSCTGFPYSQVIKDGAQHLETFEKSAFKKISFEKEEFKYVSLGDSVKPLVILIHGSPGSWRSFAHFFKDQEILSQFDLATYSRFGYEGNRQGIPYKKLDDQILLPRLILQKIKNKRDVIVVGHSYGGPVALKLAMDYPELVDAVLIAAGSVDPSLEKTKWYQYIANLWGIRSIIPDDLDVCNREILGLKKELLEMESSYSKFSKPIYVIQGEEDELVPKENADYLKSKINSKYLKIKRIPRANHFLPWGHFEAFKVGLEFLRKEVK